MTTKISSPQQWRQVTSANSIVVTDFYADWCGPCKVIAPTFEALASKFAKPNRIAFAKVDVDSQREIAQQYGVRAMPTFVILRNGAVLDTVRGANPPALTAAVEKAVKLATGGGGTFVGSGRTLGTDSGSAASARPAPAAAGGIRVGAGLSRPAGGPTQGHRSWLDINRIVNAVVMFVGLYLTSLFSIDAYVAAQNSKYNRHRPPAPARVTSGAPFGGRQFASAAGTSGAGRAGSGGGAQRGATFKTLADLGSD